MKFFHVQAVIKIKADDVSSAIQHVRSNLVVPGAEAKVGGIADDFEAKFFDSGTTRKWDADGKEVA